jgi:DNA-binding MarR family transcriptional regulator
MLGLLDAVGRNNMPSQRRLASDLGVALGLVNAYLKRCTKKGLVKVRSAPAGRYIYYLTPRGFAEKSRLAVEYLYVSLGYFRQVRSDLAELLREAKANGVERVLLAGRSELAEIAVLCAIEQQIEIIGLVDADVSQGTFVGRPVFVDFQSVPESFDLVVVTDLRDPVSVANCAVALFGRDRVSVMPILSWPSTEGLA